MSAGMVHDYEDPEHATLKSTVTLHKNIIIIILLLLHNRKSHSILFLSISSSESYFSGRDLSERVVDGKRGACWCYVERKPQELPLEAEDRKQVVLKPLVGMSNIPSYFFSVIDCRRFSTHLSIHYIIFILLDLCMLFRQLGGENKFFFKQRELNHELFLH